MKDYEIAKAVIAASRDSDFVGRREIEWISTAESLLDIEFPPTYRRFLQELGCGGFRSEEFYGIVSEDLTRGPVPNAVWLTLRLRQSNTLSGTMVVVQARGDGTHYVIDTSKHSGDGESPVMLLSVDGGLVEEAAEDFGKFLLDRILSTEGDPIA